MSITTDTAAGTRLSALAVWWSHHHRPVMRSALLLMAFAAAVWLSYEFWRLLFQVDRMGAIDLRLRVRDTTEWFAGRPIYESRASALYPPASYTIFWPLVGWLDFSSARWLWAVITVSALAWFAHVMIRECQASTRFERTFVVLMLLAIYPTGAAIGNGQLIPIILPMLVGGTLMLADGSSSWRRDLMASAMILIALAKPSVSAPFLWIVLLTPRSLRPFMLLSVAYLGLTLLAASYMDSSLMSLLRGWLSAGTGVAGTGGHADLSVWLGAIGLDQWILPSALSVFLLFGAWAYRHRDADPWLLMAVAAIVARMWIYHLWYDDLLLLLPMIALYRIARIGAPRGDAATLAGLLLAAMIAAMIAPGGLYLLPSPWNTAYVAGQLAVWAAVLAFLLHQAGNPRTCGEKRLHSAR